MKFERQTRSKPSFWMVAVLVGTTFACRPEPGEPDYASQEDFGFEGDALAPENLPGPNPYVSGQLRLGLGAFYEGGASQTVEIDGVTKHFYIYAIEATQEPTFSQATTDERVEGLRADRITHLGGPWWGGGIHWDVAQDLSQWGTLRISLRSSDDAFSEVELAMESSSSIGAVNATDYGFVGDGVWHNLEIPLSDFAQQGVNLSNVTLPLRFGGGSGTEGETLLLDDLHFVP